MRDYRTDPRCRKYSERVWVIPDEHRPKMFRVLNNGATTDMVNRARAWDAARSLTSAVQ